MTPALPAHFRKIVLSKRERMLFAATTAILVALLGVSAYSHYHGILRGLDKDISRAEFELMAIKNALAQSGDLSSEYEMVIKGALNPKDTDALLQEIETIARKLDVQVLNMKPSVIEGEGPYRTFSVRMESETDVASFTRFLNALTEGMKSIAINRLQIQLKPDGMAPKIQMAFSTIGFKEQSQDEKRKGS